MRRESYKDIKNSCFLCNSVIFLSYYLSDYFTILGITERKTRHKEQARQEILRVARQIALKEGWTNVSTRRIAHEIEYSTTKIYHEFGIKDELMVELQKTGFLQLKQRFEAAQAQSDNPEIQLMAVSLAHWQFAQSDKELYQVMFGLQGANCASSPTKEVLLAGQIVQNILKNIATSYHFGIFLHWWALMHGFISLHMLDQGNNNLPIDQILPGSIQCFIAGLKK